MRGIGKGIAIFLSVMLWAQVSTAQAAPSPAHRARKRAPQAAPVLPPAPSGPLQPVPMDQLPAAPPQVSFQNGLLSISAQNSTLGDVLRQVQQRTGASIEVPPNASERVVVNLGPAPPRDVLANLLNGTSFNYVMVGSNTDPGGVASVLLTPKPMGAAPVASQTAQVYQPAPVVVAPGPQFPPNRAPGMALAHPNQQPLATASDDSQDDSEDADDKDDSDDEAAAGQAGQTDTSGTAQTPPNAGPKTPEQILEMLRRPNQQQPNGQTPPTPPENTPEPQN